MARLRPSSATVLALLIAPFIVSSSHSSPPTGRSVEMRRLIHACSTRDAVAFVAARSSGIQIRSRGVGRLTSASSSYLSLNDACRLPTHFRAQSSTIIRHLSTSSSDAPSSTSTTPNNKATTTNDEFLYANLKSISSQLRHHDNLYYNSGQPTISDDEYDALAREEAQICTHNPDLVRRLEEETGLGKKATRWGGRVGYVQSDDEDSGNTSKTTAAASKIPVGRTRGKLQHLASAPMMSLDNAMNDGDVVRWLNRIRKLILPKESTSKEDGADDDDEAQRGKKSVSLDILAEPKMDGLSLSLRYELANVVDDSDEAEEEGHCVYKFKWGATRGDGKRGEDVTEGVMPLLSSEEGTGIPSEFRIVLPESAGSPPPIIEVRGEVVLPKKTFQRLRDVYDKYAAESEAATNSTSSDDEEAKKDGDGQKSSGDDNTPILPVRFANARNAASGILLRSKEDVSGEAAANTRMLRSYLRFYAYDVAAADVELFGSDGEEMRQVLQDCGFNVPQPTLNESIEFSVEKEVRDTQLAGLFQFHQRLAELRDAVDESETNLDHDVDGAVYKISALDLRQRLGSSARAPRWSIAHKFPIQASVTNIQGVEVQVGRTGALTPVAILEPVDIGGVSVSRASLHNFWFAAQLLCPDRVDEGSAARVRKGTGIVVGRAGDVIPQVLRLMQIDDELNGDTKADDGNDWISIAPPPTCPACGSQTFFDLANRTTTNKRSVTDTVEGTDEVSSPISTVEQSTGQVLRCSAPQLLCPPRATGALKHAFSRPGLDVSGISEARLQQLVDEGLIHVPADLFRIVKGNDLEQIASLPGWGPKSSEKLASVAKEVATSGISLSRFIYSLGIRHIGVHTSTLIAAAYGTVSAFLADVDAASKSNNKNDVDGVHPFHVLAGDDGVKGIGPVMVESLFAFSKNEALVDAAKDLAKAVKVLDEIGTGSGSSTPGPFDGLTVVFTGAVPGMSRTEAQQAAIKLGAKKTPGSISGSTDLVVEGDKGGKKALKAKDMGIKVIGAEEYLKLISQ